MRTRADIECWLTDMDGVLVHENTPIPGAAELLEQWRDDGTPFLDLTNNRSEEHTSELQSLMRISYAVFCLKKKKQDKIIDNKTNQDNTQDQHTNTSHARQQQRT